MALGFKNVRAIVTMIFVMAFIFGIGNNNFMANGECEDDIPSLISQCAKFVMKAGKQIPPSSECCDVVKNADIPCLCKYVTKDIERYVSPQKAVFVAQSCGVALQHGSKCGSK
ncbi:hypothetical protein RND81_03G139900 [Saponaria officinalis]|uniref:Bifunctional inhibitor/plant lipid transfer protein/seed storage helical domain-containing protein n=1 Tax=Saponaria officinalis TaxID=3572 RepID=A0AAW1M0C8_SAPOF